MPYKPSMGCEVTTEADPNAMGAKIEVKGDTVMVTVRMRPFNKKEIEEKRGPCITLDYANRTVEIVLMEGGKPAGTPNKFTFDSVWGEKTVQKDFYVGSCSGLVDAVLQGFNGTIFAYGQTGCGKTWTMQGVLEVQELRGVIPCAFDHIFEHIGSKPTTKFLTRACYLEIYNEQVRDLLGGDPKAQLPLKEHPDKGVFVEGLTEEVVFDSDSINLVMARGEQYRTTGATLMNAGSSRSHSIFTVVVEEYGEETPADAAPGAPPKEFLRAGKLNLVDLAGSETTSKTGATGDRMKEGVNINKSLSALGNVISALVDGKGKHIPYRDSKLTRLLQSSLGGNCRTLMMAAISPADYNYNETLSTLRYAARAKSIKNKAKVNEDPKDAMLREYKEEITKLKKMLAAANGGEIPAEPAAEAAPPKDDAGGADTPTREPPRRSLTAEDLTEEDRTARLSGPAPEVEPEVSTFLKDGDLAKYEDMLARRGVNTMDALTAPWLRVAEGFLVDKVGMTPLDVARFQALLDLHEKGMPLASLHAKAPLSDEARAVADSLSAAAGAKDDSNGSGGGGGGGLSLDDDNDGSEGGSASNVDVWAVAPGDTVTYWSSGTGSKRKTCVGTVLAGAVPQEPLESPPEEGSDQYAIDLYNDAMKVAGLEASLTVWDGQGEVAVLGKDLQTRLAAPPNLPGNNRGSGGSSDNRNESEVEASFALLREQLAETEKRTQQNGSSSRLDSTATSVSTEKLDAERVALAKALLGAGGGGVGDPTGDDGGASGGGPPLDSKAALKAQLAAAKEFIKNHEMEKSFREKSMRERDFQDDDDEDDETAANTNMNSAGGDLKTTVQSGGGWAFVECALGGCFLAVNRAPGSEELPVLSVHKDTADYEQDDMLWRFLPDGAFQNKATGWVLQTANDSSARKADVVCALPDIEPDGSLGLQCKWKQNNDHGLENAAVGYLLTVRNGSKKHNTEVWLNAAKPKVGALGGATSAQKWSLLPHGDQSDIPTTVLPPKAPAAKERSGRKGRRPSAGLARKRSDDDVSSNKNGGSEDDEGGNAKGPRRRRPPSKGPPPKRGDGFDPSWSEDPNGNQEDGDDGDADDVSAYGDDDGQDGEDEEGEEVKMSGFAKLKKNRLQPDGTVVGKGGKGGGRGGRGGRGVKPSIGKAKRRTSRGGGESDDNDDGFGGGGTGGGRLRMESTGSIDSFNDEAMGLGEGFGSGRAQDAPADPLEDQWDLEEAPAYDGPVEEAPPLIDDKLCPVCGDKLIRKTRRHCRACGHGCCYPCSDQRMRLPQFGLPKMQPVCELCHEALADEQTAMAAAAAAASAREPGRGGTIAEVKKRQEEAAATALDAQTESGAASEAMAAAVAQHRDAAQAHAELAAAAEAEAAAAKKQETHSPAVTAARRLADEKAEKLKVFLEAEKAALAAAAAKGGGGNNGEADSGGPALLDGDAPVSGGPSLVDGATGRDSLFADVLFGFEAWRANKIRAAGQGGSAEGIQLRQRQQEVRNELAAATTAMEQATAKAAPSNAKGKKDSKGSAGGGLSQQQLDELRDNKERLEAELTQLEVDVQLSDVLDNSPTSEPTFAKKLRPLPPIWERGISLAALQLFAAEMVSSDAVPTSSVVAALRQRLAKSGRRTALVGLLADCGLRTLVRQRPRLVDEWGIEYDDPSSLHHHPSEYPEVEVVVAATGQPNLFLSHAWSGSFHDSIAACVAWCGQQQPEPLNPAAVYVWMDAFCLDQWTEVTGAVGNVVVGNSSGNGNSSSSSGASALAGTANGSSGGAGSSTFHARLANESSIVEGFVFAVRACGSTVCVASPGFTCPTALERLWCCAEVYTSVCVGAQCYFSLPPDEQEAFDEVVYAELPALLRRVVHGFDIRQAECTSGADKLLLLKWLKSGQRSWGLEPAKDLLFVNRAIASSLRAFLVQSARRVLADRNLGGAATTAAAATAGMENDALSSSSSLSASSAAMAAAAMGGSSAGTETVKDLNIMRGYAMLLEEQGRAGVGGGRGWCFKLAVIWYLKVLRVQEQTVGPLHLQTSKTILALAALFKLQGKRDDALIKYERAVAALETLRPQCGALGRSLVAAARCDLAVVLRDVGRLEDAVGQFKQSRRDLGQPAAAAAASNPSESDAARRARYELLKAAAFVLGLEGRGGDEGLLFEGLCGMAAVRVLQGQHEASLVLFEEALEEQESVLGDGHPATLNTIQCIAALRRRLLVGLEDTMAVDQLERTLHVYEVVFGRHHPHTVSVVLQLAAAHARMLPPQQAPHNAELKNDPGAEAATASLRCYARALAEYAEDEALVNEETAARTHFLKDGSFQRVSAEDPDSQAIVAYDKDDPTNSASSHYDLMTLHAAKHTGGQYSPLDTAACVNNMAVEFRKLGMLNEAAESFARALHIKERELGQFHPSTAKVMNNYALVRWRMGHLDSALDIFNQLLTLYAVLDDAAQRLPEEGDDENEALGGEGAGGVMDARAMRRSGDLRFSRDTIARGVPPEDVAMTLCHVALVHQQLSQPSEAIVHFGRALKLREQVLKSAEDLCFQINNGNGNGVSGSKRQAQQALRAARAAVASTLYNRGLIYHQQGDLLSAGADLRRGLVESRHGLGGLHAYTADAAGALAFVARALGTYVAQHQDSNPRHPANGMAAAKSFNKKENKKKKEKEKKKGGGGGGAEGELNADGSPVKKGAQTEFEHAKYEAHRDECLACFDALCAHWKEAKGRGHPAAVAALNSVAEVYRWEVRQNDCASALMRALRESNAHVEPAAVATAAAATAAESDAAAAGAGAGAGMLAAFGSKGKAAAAEASKRAAVTAEVGEQTAEAAQAAAAADEKESRIAHLREEKQAAVAREDYKAATRLKQEILELQLQVIELEELTAGRTLPEGAVGGGSGRKLYGAIQAVNVNEKRAAGMHLAMGTLAQAAQSAGGGGNANNATGKKLTDTWGSSQLLAQETRLDELAVQGWATPDEDEAALKARLETLNGLAQAMVDKTRHEEAAAYHARVLKLTQKAVHGKSGAGQWPRQALVAPLVALAGAAFSLQHLGQARTLYEQALQVTEKEAGATSPDTAAALNDLAIVVRELHEDQEALQLHARAIRIRQKTLGVWNATVAETLFNVSLIYKDLEDLASALQCCRGCCRVYGLVFGHDHKDTRDANTFLNELSAAHKEKKTGFSSLFSLSCLGSSSSSSAHDSKDSQANDGLSASEAHDLSANPRLRMAFRTVLEEINQGPPRSTRNLLRSGSDASAAGLAGGQPGSFGGSFAGGKGQQSSSSMGGGKGGGNVGNGNGMRSLSEVLAASDAEEQRVWTAGTGGTDNMGYGGVYGDGGGYAGSGGSGRGLGTGRGSSGGYAESSPRSAGSPPSSTSGNSGGGKGGGSGGGWGSALQANQARSGSNNIGNGQRNVSFQGASNGNGAGNGASPPPALQNAALNGFFGATKGGHSNRPNPLAPGGGAFFLPQDAAAAREAPRPAPPPAVANKALAAFGAR